MRTVWTLWDVLGAAICMSITPIPSPALSIKKELYNVLAVDYSNGTELRVNFSKVGIEVLMFDVRGRLGMTKKYPQSMSLGPVLQVSEQSPDRLDMIRPGLLLHLGGVEHYESREVTQVEVRDYPKHLLGVLLGGPT